MRLHPILMLPCLLLTIPGCGQGGPASWTAPVVLDLAPVRCPEPDPRIEAEFRRTTPRPEGPLSKDDVRRWIDTLELSERRKNARGQQVIEELERCRNAAQSAVTS